MKINKFTSIVASLMLAGVVTTLSACPSDVDIKPTSCPNPVNAKADKNPDKIDVLPVAILGKDGKPASELLGNTVKLYWAEGENGDKGLDPEIYATAIRTSVEDVAGPDGEPGCDLSDKEASCGTEGPDGYDDFTMKFDKDEVIAVLEESMGRILEDGDLVCVQVHAATASGERRHGTDVIWIKKPGKSGK